jgi:heme-binding HmuY-like protein
MATRTAFGFLLLLSGCGGGDSGSGDADADTDADSDADADSDTDTGGGVCDPVTIPCTDAIILDLSLHADMVSTGEVATTQDGDDFVTTIDATAGGFGNSDQNPWVYVRFDADGAHRVDIDDEAALESQEWHMALRRFIVRLNGGDSGPSCVGAVPFLEQTYDALTTVPDGIEYGYDDFYTDSCGFVNDSSGLPGSPQVVLGAWWDYAGCVGTTAVPHLVQLEDGSVIKLVVESYYEDPADQQTCNDTDTEPAGAVSGYYTIRWTFM